MRTSRSAIGSAPPQLRVERVAQPVADQVDRQHGDRIATPGIVTTHQALVMNSRASASMVPHSGVGGCAPMPRKPSAAASRMAFEKLSVACTISGPRQFGRIVTDHQPQVARPGDPCGGHVLAILSRQSPRRGSGLLDGVVDAGELTIEQRNAVLESMTDDVAHLVLANNEAQTLALVIARRQALPMVNVHARYIDVLETEGWLDRSLEFLPTDKQIAERQASGAGLQAPELAVLIAYTKNANVAEVAKTDLPDVALLEHDLVGYFPPALRDPPRSTPSAPTRCAARSSPPASSTRW